MAFEVVHTDRWHGPTEAQRTCQRRTGQQRPDQPGTGGVGDPVDLCGSGAGLLQRCAQQRHKPAQVIARCKFRHHTAESAVQIDLAPELMREQPALLIEHRHGTFIAGGLNSQNAHRGPVRMRRA
jgi:hypothetical protein